jgi:photosystem II stability/assembly factor-like uncharacterized protein
VVVVYLSINASKNFNIIERMVAMRKLSQRLRGLTVLWIVLSVVSLQLAAAQPGPGAQAPAPPPVNQTDDPLLKPFRWRSIGPASMGGRIDDIAVVESNPFIFYVGFATNGVWKTVNNGTTFEPIFETYSTASIGDIAICQPDPNIVWVGTGEPNNRQSSTFGDGIYKSADAGKTFTNMGLKETQTIARIVVDPKDCNTVYVAALGHLFGPNSERGIFKTIDGGKSWTNVKLIDQDTGFTDIVMDAVDSKILYAASFQRRRTPWGFNGGGPGSGLWKTIDAGKTWTKLEGNGLPTGILGRIGLDVSRSNPNVVYAQIEVGPSPGTGGGVGGGGGGPGGGGGQQQQQAQQPPNPQRSGVWRSDDKGKTWRIMSNNNNRPMYYSQIRVDPTNDQIVYTCGAPFHKSTDGGKTFQVVQGIAHSDHHAVWINPKNGNHLIIGNDGGLNVSYDQAATWEFVNTIPGAQFYAVAADMRRPYYVYGGLQDNGSWGGPSQTRPAGGGGGGGGFGGITNADWYRVGGGDGFYVQIDPTDYTTVYAESQNGNMLRLDLKTGRNSNIRPRAPARPAQPQSQGSGQTGPPAAPQGGGGGGGFGGQQLPPNIVPPPPAGEQYRFNWSTPLHLSPHNPRTLYTAANKLFRSLDRGDTWTVISPDLSKQIDRNKLPIMGVPGDQPMASKHDGTANYGNITTIAESPVVPGVLWVGTDDGNVQLSRDGGVSWTNVAKNIWGAVDGAKDASGVDTHQVSRVEPSHFDAATCYVTIDGHRSNDHRPYVFVTRDYGATWTSLVGTLPMGNVNVIREDPKNKDLLYLGTEYALYVSLNGGGEWKRFMTGLPTIRIDDILVHPRDNDLIVGTHGRGIYIMDDITPLQQLSDKVMAADAHLFDVRPGVQWLQDTTLGRYTGGAKMFRGPNPPPGTAISYYLKSAASGDVKITISDITGKVLRTLNGPKEAGLQRVQWNLRGDPPQRPAGGPGGGGGGGGGGGFGGAFQGAAFEPGTYLVKLSVDGKELTTKVVVEADIWKNEK